MTDTRQDPHNRPALVDTSFDQEFDGDAVQDTVLEVKELIGIRATLENYCEQIKAAGQDGLDPVAKAIMQVNLRHIGLLHKNKGIGLESFDREELPSLEDFTESLKGIGDKIAALIKKLIESAKQFAAKLSSGIENVKTGAEQLLDRIKKKASGRASNEFHNGDDRQVTIANPSILFADGEFCIDVSKAEQEVIKFFTGHWPQYVSQQIDRAKKMIGEYDVETGNSDNFTANSDFIGNHESLVTGIKRAILPGNKAINFKFVALGPELVDAEDAAEAPSEHTYIVRTDAEIQKTLRANVTAMTALGKLFSAEADVLGKMTELSKAIGQLEERRSETVWKSAKEALDTISNMMMDLITKLKPHYDPIVSHLAKVGNARNAACRQEIDAAA